MGNWRRVQIIGTCGREDLATLNAALDPGSDYENFHCLVNGGICGLPNWAKEKINAVGNLAERNYDVDDVLDQLEKLAKVAPSLSVRIHCGNENEAGDCVATVVLAEGKAVVAPPMVETIPAISESQMEANLREQLAPSS